MAIDRVCTGNEIARFWWERRSTWIVVALIGLVPLLWPALPPLTDLPGHMGRWHIAEAIGGSPVLQRYYAFTWAPIGNLGMDCLVAGLAMVLPFELAAKIGVILIPAVTTAGLLLTAREAHGRVPPTAMLALPLCYAWPFQMGFVNFELAQGLAFCAFALWLRLGRNRRFGLRAAIFVPVACGLWLAHSFGWATFCLMATGAEAVQARQRGLGWRETIVSIVVQSLSLTLPLFIMASGTSGHGSGVGDWFDWTAKGVWVASILRDRWMVFDLASLLPLVLAGYVAARHPKLGFSAVLGVPALLCLVAFLVLPRLALGGAYVDMRMAPTAAMLGLLAISPATGSARLARTLAALALTFFLARTVATSVSFAIRSAEQQREIAAVSAIPYGASVLSLVSRPCGGVWSDRRLDHIPGMAIVRRDVFTNEQWDLAGQQLLRIRHGAAAPYLSDPSQLVYPQVCASVGSRFDVAVQHFARAGFTHVWTIGFPPTATHPSDLALIWSNGGSALYRVRRPLAPLHR